MRAALRVIASFVALALWSAVAVAQTPQLLDAADQSLAFYQKGELLNALPFAEEAARLAEEEFGADHVTTAKHTHNLAAVYQQLGWLDFAEPLLVRALAIREGQLGADHPLVAQTLNNLAVIFHAQKRFVTAEEYYLRSQVIWEAVYGLEHREVATSYNNLAGLYYLEGRFEEAEPLFLRSLEIRRVVLGNDHPDVAQTLKNYAILLRSWERPEDADVLEQEARDTGQVVASGRINLVQGGGTRPGVLIFSPIYRPGTPVSSVEERRVALLGYALAVLDIQRTVADAIDLSGAAGGPGFEIDIFDLEAAPGDSLVLSVSVDPDKQPAIPTIQRLQSGVHAALEISVGDRMWLVISTPSGPEFSGFRNYQPWVGAVPVFLIVLLLGFYVRANAARSAEIRSLVADRTETLNAILNTVDDGIITIDSLGVVQTFNASAVQIFGHTPEQVIGNNVRMLMPEPYKGEHDGYVGRYLTTGETRVIGIGREVFGQRKDGRVFPMSLAVREMPIAGKRMFTGVVRDITDLKAVEGLKNEFVSTVSHELRTPLTSIKGALGLIRSGVTGELPERLNSMLEIAYSNSDRLIRLINDILDIEKIEAGKMNFHMNPVNLSDIVVHSVEQNHTIGEERSVVLHIAEKLPVAMVSGDRDRLTQVMANFLSNAAKFSPIGGTVKVAVGVQKNTIRASVSDNGSGVPDEFKDLIFEKFSQADSTDTRSAGGTGLGLNICRAIVERHGGQIGFEATPGGGTTFFFELPILDVAKVGEKSEPLSAGSQTVLICEDEPDIAELLRLILESGGVHAHVADSAEVAAEMLMANRYAAMTLDLNLPGKDGLTFMKELRENPATRDLPIVVVSVISADEEDTINGDAINVVDWIEKPVDTERLLHAIDRARVHRGGLPKILHVEDDPDLRDIVADLLGDHAEVVPAGSFSQAQEQLAEHDFDLVLLDLDLPDRPGTDLLSELAGGSQVTAPPVIVFSATEVSRELADEIHHALVKSQTSNEELLASVLSAFESSRKPDEVK